MTTPNIPRLDLLPAELIVHIATRSSPDSVFALSRVCRALHRACYDPHVFYATLKSKKWAIKYLGDHIQDNISLIARYALAESRYERLLDAEKSDAAEAKAIVQRTSDLLRYLPQLAVLDNPVLDDDKTFLFGQRACMVSGVSSERDLSDEFSGLGFKRPVASLVAACGLMRAAPTIPLNTCLDDEESDHNKITFYSYDRLTDGIRDQTEGHIKEWHYNCLIGVGKMATLLSCAFPSDHIRRLLPNNYLTAWPRFEGQFKFPAFARMPINKTAVDIPLPYLSASETAEAWKHWLRRQRCMQSTPAYMDSGEWLGMYIYHDPFPLGAVASVFDAPMTGMQFRTEGPITSTGGFISRASGQDGVGTFDLTLSMDADGYVRGLKAYRNSRIRWDWKMSNTPFGLYGTWANSRDNDAAGLLGGAVWLWKREWCD